jgi:predicted transposase YbfD/YdcC
MVSGWGCEQRRVLGQIAAGAKSNEITLVPKLLEMLSLKGCAVTVDALDRQRGTARKIVDQGGGHALALDGNQGTLDAGVSRFLDDIAAGEIVSRQTVDGDHGRSEPRFSVVANAIGWLQESHPCPGHKAAGKVTRTRETATKTSVETASCLLSAPLSSERFGDGDHAHCGVENKLRPVLDVAMNEDQAETASITGRKNLTSAAPWRRTSSPTKNPKSPTAGNSPEPAGARLPRQPRRPVLKCDCPAPSWPVPSLVEQRMADAIADPQADTGRRPGVDFENTVGGSARGDNFFRQGVGIFGEADHLAGAADENHIERQISVLHPHRHRPLGREVEQHATLLRKKPAEHQAAFALRPAAHDFHGKFMGSAGGDDLKPF